MTEYLSKQAIRAREYAGRTDLTEVILADAVEKVGEGAFSRCTALARVTVGRGVREIGPEAFTNLPANAGFVWLSRTLYRSPFMRILPPFSRVGWIAAPYAPFAGRPFEEQLVLALGFLLCPELEELYPEEKRSACRDFLFAELRKDPSRTGEKDCTAQVIRSLWERWPEDAVKPVLAALLDYARSRKTGPADRQLFDRISREAGLFSGTEPSSGQGDRSSGKWQIRALRASMSEEEVFRILEGAGAAAFPPVRYRDETADAPPELVKFIAARYIGQWNSARRVQEFHIDRAADETAEQLCGRDLRQALEQGIRDVGMPGSLIHPERWIPFARFTEREGLLFLTDQERLLRDHASYGAEGYQAAELLRRAVLLNPDREAAVFAAREGLLKTYASVHALDGELLFFSLMQEMEQEGRPEQEAFLRFAREQLRSRFLDGKGIPAERFFRTCLLSAEIRDLLEGTVFHAGSKTAVFQNGSFFGTDGSEVPLTGGEQLSLAHPCELRREEVRAFLRIQDGMPAFRGERLYEPEYWIRPDNYHEWKDRYRDLLVPWDLLASLSGKGFRAEGRRGGTVRFFFGGQAAFAADTSDKTGAVRCLEMPRNGLSGRMLAECIHLLDGTFFYEMLLDGRISVQPYLQRLSAPQKETLFAASVRLGHHGNAALLLEEKKKAPAGAPVTDGLPDW